MPGPTYPPPLDGLNQNMLNLRRSLRERTDDGGSTHLHNPADLYTALTHLVTALDLVPSVLALLTDHMRAWHDNGQTALTPLAPDDHTEQEGMDMITMALSSSSAAQEHTSRSLGVMLMVISHYAPNVPERAPGESAVCAEDARTTRDAIRHLQNRIARDTVQPLADGWVSEAWLYLMIQVMGNAIREGRRADAVKTLTDPAISDGTWRPKALALLVEMAEMIADVEENGRENLG
jgi:hypothetical protein